MYHNAALAEQEVDAARADQGSITSAGQMTKGRLPNLDFGLHGQAVLEEHDRYVSLPPPQEISMGQVLDAQLPHIPQRTPQWFAARRSAITASNAAVWLGLKEPGAARSLAEAGLKVHADIGSAQLQKAWLSLMAATMQLPAPAEERSTFAVCAMEIGTRKEPDVLLTYCNYMDATQRCDKTAFISTFDLNILVNAQKLVLSNQMDQVSLCMQSISHEALRDRRHCAHSHSRCGGATCSH